MTLDKNADQTNSVEGKNLFSVLFALRNIAAAEKEYRYFEEKISENAAHLEDLAGQLDRLQKELAENRQMPV